VTRTTKAERFDFSLGFQFSDFIGFNGAPGEIRTPGLLIRSQSLYPAELRALLVYGTDGNQVLAARRPTPGGTNHQVYSLPTWRLGNKDGLMIGQVHE
jgi:hypothetical protein